MGIPSYFSTIKRKYAKHYNEWMTNELSTHTDCKHLYVDMNGIVHTCAQRIVRLYETYLIQTYRSLSHTQLQQLVQVQSETIFDTVLQPYIFKSIWSELQNLLDTVKPTELMFLALDGVAPRAKMEQQRQRRHRSVCDTAIEQTIYNRHQTAHLRGLLWDSNCVTPGTTFMTALATFMHSQIQHTHSNTSSTCKIHFSDTNEHGEGEHKILEHMRTYASLHEGDEPTTQNKRQSAFVLYGQDADLIMLGLAFISQHNIPFYLLRESIPSTPHHKKDNVNETVDEEMKSESVIHYCSVDDSSALFSWMIPAETLQTNIPLQYLNVVKNHFQARNIIRYSLS